MQILLLLTLAAPLWAHQAPSYGAPQQVYQQQPPPQQGYQQQQQGYQQQPPPQQAAYQQPPQYQQQPPQQLGYAPQQPHGHAHAHGGANANILDKSHVQDREHIKEHLQGIVDQPDFSKMSEEELQFHYFKMHDNDDNNKLDGCELIKSVLHWHVEESRMMSQPQHPGAAAPPQQQQPQQGGAPQGGPGSPPPTGAYPGTTKIFTDQELISMIDPIMEMDDRNRDGYIDYPEFVAAQKSRGF